jgi:hypothetical protein
MISHILLYIDPGSGSYLVQVIIAGALGIAFFFRNIKNSIKAFFTRSSKKTNETDSMPDGK